MEKDGSIGWLIFNRPEKRNAVGIETWQLMPDYVKDLASDDAIRVVILRGAGDKAFVAGADISQFKDRRRNMEDEAEYRRIGARGREALNALTKPLLAMIHGYCVGGGVAIAIGCDMRIASDDARFGIPAARLGLGYHYGGMEQLMALVGPSVTKEIFFTARTDWTRPGRAPHGAGQPGRAQGGAGGLHARVRAHDREERAADDPLGEGDGERAGAAGGQARLRHARRPDRRLLQQRGLPGRRAGVRGNADHGR